MTHHYNFKGVVVGDELVSLPEEQFIIELARYPNKKICVTLQIINSVINAIIDYSCTISDLWEIEQHIQRLALFQVAADGVGRGLGFDVYMKPQVVLTTEKSPAQNIPVTTPQLPVTPPELDHRLKEVIAAGPHYDARSPFLRLAAINYMHAIREPQETFMFSYRAVESIRQYFVKALQTANGNSEKELTYESWTKLRTTLNIGPEKSNTNYEDCFLQWLTDRAEKNRHGELTIPCREQYLAAITTAHTIILRFVAYDMTAERLSLGDFPWLKVINDKADLPSCLSIGERDSRSTTNSTSVVQSSIYDPRSLGEKEDKEDDVIG